MSKENKVIEEAVKNTVKIDNKNIAIQQSEEAIDELQHLNTTKEKAVTELRETNKENQSLNKTYLLLTIFSLLVAGGSLIIALISLFL